MLSYLSKLEVKGMREVSLLYIFKGLAKFIYSGSPYSTKEPNTARRKRGEFSKGRRIQLCDTLPKAKPRGAATSWLRQRFPSDCCKAALKTRGRKDSGLGSCYIQLQPRLVTGKEYMITFLHYLFSCFYLAQLFATCCYLILTP